MTVNVTRDSMGHRIVLSLPKHKGLADALTKAGVGELSSAAAPGSGGSPVVTLYHMRTAHHYARLLAAAAVPDDAETAAYFTEVRDGLTGALADPAARIPERT